MKKVLKGSRKRGQDVVRWQPPKESTFIMRKQVYAAEICVLVVTQEHNGNSSNSVNCNVALHYRAEIPSHDTNVPEIP